MSKTLIEEALALEGVEGIAADLVKSIYQQESVGGANSKTSNRGAVGGMQILPTTFNGVADEGWDIKNPLDNARAGIRYVLEGLEMGGGNPKLAAAYYYGGPNGLKKAARGEAVFDSKNPNAPSTLQYADQVASRMGLSSEKENSKERGEYLGLVSELGSQSTRPTTQPYSKDRGEYLGLVSELYPQQKEKPAAAKQEEKGFFENFGALAKQGFDSAVAGGRIADDVATGNIDDNSASIITGQLNKKDIAPKELKEVQAEMARTSKEGAEAGSFTENPIGNMKAFGNMLYGIGEQLITNPKGVAYMTAEQLANMAPSIVGMIAGAKVGGAAGAVAAPVTGGLSVPIGAAVGGFGGAFAGEWQMEAASQFIGSIGKELQARGLKPTEENVIALFKDQKLKEKIISESRSKATVTSAVDSLFTLGAGRLVSAPARAAQKQAIKELGEAATKEAIEQRAKSIIAERTFTQKIANGGKALALDVTGGGASEAAGQQYAYGDVDLGEVQGEILGEIGGAGIEIPAASYAVGRDTYQSGRDKLLAQKAEKEAARKEQQTNADAAMAAMPKAQSVDDAIALATEAINTPIEESFNDLTDESIDLNDVLGDENVSDTAESVVTGLDSQAAAQGVDNTQGSAGDSILVDEQSAGVGDNAGTLGGSGSGDISLGTGNAQDGAVSEPLGNSEQLPNEVVGNADNVPEPSSAEATQQKSNKNGYWNDLSSKSKIEFNNISNSKNGRDIAFLAGGNLSNGAKSRLKSWQNKKSEAAKISQISDFGRKFENGDYVDAQDIVLIAKLSLKDAGDIENKINSPIDLAIAARSTLSEVNKNQAQKVDFNIITAKGQKFTIKASQIDNYLKPVESLSATNAPATLDNAQSLPAVQKPLSQKPKKTISKKSNTLNTRLIDLGGVQISDKSDISGESGRGIAVGYNRVFRKDSRASLKGHIENGDLDDYLPPAMRLSSSTMQGEAYDSTDAYDYLADRIRNGDRVLPYDVEEEIKANQFYQQHQAQDIPDGNGINDDEINKLLSEAGYDERERDAENRIYGQGNIDQVSEITEQGNADSNIVSAEREQARGTGTSGIKTTSPIENAGQVRANPQVAEKTREVITQLVKLRKNAQQISKEEEFDEVLKAAKAMMEGKEVKSSTFKSAFDSFERKPDDVEQNGLTYKQQLKMIKYDEPIAKLLNELHEISKPIESAAKVKRQFTFAKYKKNINDATSADDLYAIARQMAKDSAFDDNDAKYVELNALIDARVDALELDVENVATNDTPQERVDENADDRQDFTLTGETNAEILAKEQAKKAEEEAQAKAEKDAQAEKDKKAAEEAQRKNAGERPFVFGEDDAIVKRDVKAGVDDMFTQQEAIEAIKQDETIPTADKIKLAADLRRGDVNAEDVSAIVGEQTQNAPKKKQTEFKPLDSKGMWKALNKLGYPNRDLSSKERRVTINQDAIFPKDRFEIDIELKGDKWSIFEIGVPDTMTIEQIDAMTKFRSDLAELNGEAKPSQESNPFDAYNTIANQYGYSIGNDGVILKSNGEATSIKAVLKKGRLRLENKNDSNDLVASYPDKSESIATFLEKYWFAEKKKSNNGNVAMFSRSVGVKNQTETEAFKQWSNGNTFIPLNSGHDFRGGEPVVVQALHGTTADFSIFDNEKLNIESDMGGGFYFTNERGDVGENYAGRGPDLTQKIQLLAERIASETDREYDDPDVIKEAEERFIANDGFTMPVYVRFDNPIVIGGRYETKFTYEENYNEELDEFEEPTGTLVDFVDALRSVESDFSDGSVEEVIDAIFQEAADGEVYASDIERIMKETESFNYYTDENGNLASNELKRLAFEYMGFDGVIDQTVNKKFGSKRQVGKKMDGMNENTVHFIAFKPTQIKSSLGNNGNFSTNNPDIRYARDSAFKRPQSLYDQLFGAPDELKQQVIDGAQRTVDAIRANWENAPDVEVVYDMDDERIRKVVRDENERQLSQGATGAPEGFFDDGKVYIVAGALKTPQDVARVLLHESLGHYGLRGTFGKDLTKILDQIASLKKNVAHAKAKQYGLAFTQGEAIEKVEKRLKEDNAKAKENNLPETKLTNQAIADRAAKLLESDRLIAAEEVLAEMAQNTPEIGFVKRAIAAIRNWLRANVPYFKDMKLSDDDIIEAYIFPARNYVVNGGNPTSRLVRTNNPANLSRSSLPDTITVDGIERPTLNSNGKPIHPTREGVEKFWRWFSPSPSQLLDGLSVAEVSSIKRNAESLSDFIESQSRLPKSDSFSVIPTPVFSHMSGVVSNSKILDAVVRTLPIDVVNFLERKQFSAKEVLHNPSMLKDVLSINGSSDVSLGINPSVATNILMRVIANAGAKVTSLTNGALERNAAMLADANNPIFGTHVKKSPYKDLSIIAGFGDSKVVDEQNRPVVVYHGTKESFSEFDTLKDRTNAGFWFGTSATASRFAMADRKDGVDTGQNVMPVYLSLKNPYIHSPVYDFGLTAKGVIDKAKKDESDGVRFFGEKSGEVFVVFGPEQIKSAIGNTGDFNPANPSILFSRSTNNERIVGDSEREYTPAQLKALERTGSVVKRKTFAEKWDDVKRDLGKKLAQGLADQFRPIKDISSNAYTLLRLSKGASGAMEALMNYGKLSIKDGAFDADTSGGVLDKVFRPIGKEATDFLRWVAGNRAERLAKAGLERLFTDEDIAAFKSLSEGTTGFDYTLRDGTVTRDRTKIYADTLTKFNEFNKNVLDMAEQSGLIDGNSRKLWEHEFYVPFYRLNDDDPAGVRGMNIKKGVVRQEAFKKLKGGDAQLNDLMSNVLMNWHHLIDASAKNRAAMATVKAAENVGIATPTDAGGKNTVWFMENGEKKHFYITEPDVMDALVGLEFAGMRNFAMDAMSKTKHMLTIGVTASPFFKVRNLIRDSVQAIATSDLSYNPLGNVKQGWQLTDKSDGANQTYVSALAGGGLIRFGTMTDGNEAAHVRRLIKSGVRDEALLNSEGKLKDFWNRKIIPVVEAYNELGNRGEEVNRMALYDQLIKKGIPHSEASLMARDLMDFSMQGSWTAVRFLTQIVPFMNARIQGMYKLGRSATGSKESAAKMAIVTGAVTLVSLALLAAYGDDDDWKKREEWDRDNYWWFKVGGIAYRIPKPFEVGAVATLGERMAELVFDDEMTKERFAKVVLELTSNQLSMNPIPQAVKPIIDVYSNKDSFTGRDIESMSMERLAPDYRFNANTSYPARAISTAGNTLTGDNFLSPLQVDHLIHGYFGWLGSFIVGGADLVARGASDEPKRATLDYFKLATGGMASKIEGSHSRYVTQVYDQAKELEQSYNTYRALLREGKKEDAAEYLSDNREDIAKYRNVEGVKKQMSFFQKAIKNIEKSESLSADEKRVKINALMARQEAAARRLYVN